MDNHNKKICNWINDNLVQAKKFNHIHSSYNLKHWCEDTIDEYVSNDEMKECMLKMGYEPYDKTQINWHFKLPHKLCRELREERNKKRWS